MKNKNNKSKSIQPNQLPAASLLHRQTGCQPASSVDGLQAKKGFTLIELLISMAIIAIVTGAMLSVVKFSGTKHNLVLEANKVLAAVRSAQSYSLAVPNNEPGKICGFGFEVVDVNTYRVFYVYYTGTDVAIDSCKAQLRGNPSEGNDYYRSDEAPFRWQEEYKLPTGIQFSGGVGTEIFFSVPYGEVYQEGSELTGSATQTYTITSADDEEIKSIIINKFGKINLQ